MSRINPNKGLYLKPLYLAKNIDQLQTLKPTCMSILSSPQPVPSKDNVLPLLPSCQVSQKIFAVAKESEIIGDQEKAYVYLFKYCEFVKTIQRSPEYKIDRLYYDTLVSSRRVKNAFDNLDQLTIVLKERYNEKEREEALCNMETGFKGIKLQTSNQGLSLMNLEPLESAQKKAIKEKLQAEEESQNQICKVLLKNSEDQVSKLQRQIANLQAEVESKNLIHQESLKVSEDQNLRLERQVQDLQDSIMCKICMDQKVSQFLSPCNHAVCCKSCIKSIKECPICRETIEISHTIYFS